jgi:hypothetical protein
MVLLHMHSSLDEHLYEINYMYQFKNIHTSNIFDTYKTCGAAIAVKNETVSS